MAAQHRQNLKKVLSRSDVLALSFGTMIGWGWIMMPGQWIADAGVAGAVLSFLIGGVMSIFVGLTYAELATALPIAGGELAFAYRGLGYTWSWIAGWAISFAYLGVASWEGIAISTAFDYLFQVPEMWYLWTVAGYDVYLSWASIGMAGAFVLMALNMFGVKPAAIFQMMGTLGLVGSGLIFISGAAAFGDVQYTGALFTSAAGMGAVLLMTPSMLIGFDVVPQSTEEINIPLRDIATVLLLSIVLAVSWYILMVLGIAFSMPGPLRAGAHVPIADAAAYAYQTPLIGKIMILGGICGILTSWNGFMVGASRILFAMGRARMIPTIFAYTHPKYGTPLVSLGAVGILSSLAPLLGQGALVWLIKSSALGTVISYLLVAVSYLLIRIREPDLARPFSVRYWKPAGACAILSVLFFLALFLPFSPNSLIWPQEWAFVLLWSGLGLAIWIGRRKRAASPEELEMLLYGEEYAREKARRTSHRALRRR